MCCRELNPAKIVQYLLILLKPNRIGFGAHPATYACHLDLQVSFLGGHTNRIELQKENEGGNQQYGNVFMAAIKNTARVSTGCSKLQILCWTSMSPSKGLDPCSSNTIASYTWRIS